MKTNKLLVMVTLFCASLFALNGVAHAWGTAGGDGSVYTMLQETAVFFNNSGATLSAGDAVILDTSGTGVTTTGRATLGAYVTRDTSGDSTLAVGIVKSVSAADQTPVVVITKGPAFANCQCASGTDMAAGTAVGTYTTAGKIDGGTNLGIALANGGNLDYTVTATQTLIWVDPTGAD